MKEGFSSGSTPYIVVQLRQTGIMLKHPIYLICFLFAFLVLINRSTAQLVQKDEVSLNETLEWITETYKRNYKDETTYVDGKNSMDVRNNKKLIFNEGTCTLKENHMGFDYTTITEEYIVVTTFNLKDIDSVILFEGSSKSSVPSANNTKDNYYLRLVSNQSLIRQTWEGKGYEENRQSLILASDIYEKPIRSLHNAFSHACELVNPSFKRQVFKEYDPNKF